MTNTETCLMASALTLICCLCGAAQEGAQPAVVPIRPNERVVHCAGQPFNHVYYGHHLERYLLRRFAHSGLIFRHVDMKRSTAATLRSVEQDVLVHKPTLVVLQPGNVDIRAQFRRLEYDFATLPKTMEALVVRLRQEGIRVILCSPIPVGSSESLQDLSPPNKGIQGWVGAMRDMAAKHDAVFVDLFSEAVTWPMISSAKTYYATGTHQKSWELFLDQVRFEPSGSVIRVEAQKGEIEAEGAAVKDLKTDDGGVAFALENEASAGAALVQVMNLPAGDYAVSVDGKVAARKTANELLKGVDLGEFLQPAANPKALLAELRRGHRLAKEMTQVASYKLPSWVKLGDFEEQKRKALEGLLTQLDEHDRRIRQRVRPRPLKVIISPVGD